MNNTLNFRDLYLIPEDLYRIGNTSSPRMTNLRVSDMPTYERDGITIARAVNQGISLHTADDLKNVSLTGWAWKISPDVPLPYGIKLHNDKPGHYMIVPIFDMPLATYKGKLEEIALRAQKAFKMPGVGMLINQ